MNGIKWHHRVVVSGLGLVLAGCAAGTAPQATVQPAGGGGAAAANASTTPAPGATAGYGVNVTALPALATALPQIDQPVLPQSLPAGSAAQQPAASALQTAPQRLQIAEIGLDEVLLPVGLDDEMLPIVPDHNVGWYYYSARPGEGENIVMYAHVLRFVAAPDIAAPFARLHELVVGDEIMVEDSGTTFRYRVSAQVTARPDEVSYMLPKGEERLTLISCIGDVVLAEEGVSMSERLITIAEPID